MRKSIVEEWRDIPKYCGLYQASNLGYIRSVFDISNIANCCKKHQIIKGVKTTRI